VTTGLTPLLLCRHRLPWVTHSPCPIMLHARLPDIAAASDAGGAFGAVKANQTALRTKKTATPIPPSGNCLFINV